MTIPITRERLTGGESLIWACNCHLHHCQKKNHNWKGSVFVIRYTTFFLNNQSPIAWLCILLMKDVAPTLKLALASMGGMHTNFPIPSLFKIEKMILTLRPHGFLLIWIWTYHNWTLNSLQHENFPQTMPIVRTQFESQAQKSKGFWL